MILYALLFLLGANLISNAITLGAALGFASISNANIFGKQRLFGTIGFGIFAYVASLVYGFFQTDLVYIIMFTIAALICMVVTCFIRVQPSKRKRQSTGDQAQIKAEDKDDPINLKKAAPSGLSALLPALKKLDVWIFLSLAFIWGTSYAVLDPVRLVSFATVSSAMLLCFQYLYLYLDEIAPCQSRSIIGLMSLVSAASELAALFFVGKILKTLGVNLCSILILLAFAVRFAGYYFIQKAYFFICMETMHFFNFGILYVLIGQEADAIGKSFERESMQLVRSLVLAPPGLSGTLQGVAYGVLFGLGRGVGLLIGSIIYNMFDHRLLFLIFSLVNLVAAVIFSLYFLITKQWSPKSSTNTEAATKVMSPSGQ